MAGLVNFKDENEVKQFLDNLGIEYSFQCYKEKDPEGNTCPGMSGAGNPNKTHISLTKLCFLYAICMVFLSGCQRLADYLEGVKKNYENAAQVLKHNCETHGYGESCYKLGAYHVTGKGKCLAFALLNVLLIGVHV